MSLNVNTFGNLEIILLTKIKKLQKTIDSIKLLC